MTTNHAPTARERAEQAAEARWPAVTFEHYARDLFIEGFMASDADRSIAVPEDDLEGIDYKAVEHVASKYGLTLQQALVGAQALHNYEESRRGITGQIVRGVEARHIEAAIHVLAITRIEGEHP